jgi:DNA-binding ferritin-like protein (Dps family)
MNQFKLVSPEKRLDIDNRLHITTDINQAMVEFGFIIKGNFLKWMVYGQDISEGEIDTLFVQICASIARVNKLTEELKSQLYQKIDKYLYDLPSRRRIALAFILFNSEDFESSLLDYTEQSDLEPNEIKKIVGKQIEREIYVGGSYDLEIKIRGFLATDIYRFASEFSFISGGIKKERVLELLDIYSRASLASLDF